MPKQQIALAGACACFRTPFSHSFDFSCFNLMTVAHTYLKLWGFFSKKRDRLVVMSKAVKYFKVCLVATQ